MAQKEFLTVRGEFVLEKIDLDGNVIERYEDKNTIMTLGRGQLVRLLANDVTNRAVTKIGFGENSTAASPSDTALSVSAFEKAIGSATYPSTTSVQFAYTLGTTEGNGLNITEFGLICTDDVLFARKVRSVIAKTSSFSLAGTWTIFL